MEKVILDHTNEWYMQNPEPFQENETQILIWDFEIQTDQLISARRPYQVIVDKKKKKREPA